MLGLDVFFVWVAPLWEQVVCCCFFLMIDHLHVKHSSCEENYAFRSKKVTRSTTFGPKRYHLSSPQNLWPHRMGCASLTTWFPFPLKVRLNQPAYNNKKNTISPAENVVLSRGSGPTSPIRPWGPTWTWMSCPASRLFIHDCVTWNTEYLLDKSKLTWLEHHSFKAFGSDLSSSYAILHCENCAAVRCESRHMRLALPPKLHHYCCFCLSNNNSFKQCCSWS